MTRPLYSRLAHFWLPCIFVWAAGLAPIATYAIDKPKTEVADLRYGVALYNYYQQEYIPAISELMVADARDGIQGHGNNPELIAGGLSLAFGMQKHAEQLFSVLLADPTRPQNVRDAAWFYLAKLQYARSDWAGAAISLNAVSDKFDTSLLAEVRALQFNLQIKMAGSELASVKDIKNTPLKRWEPYALYNMGSAYARNGDMKSAKEYFSELIDLGVDQDSPGYNELLTLRDKTHTALGYTYLQDKNYTSAIKEFKKVRLTGMESNQALLGYGWAAIAQENYAEAIKPWQVLQHRSLLFPAAQEALIALPFAYEKLNAMGDAVREYEHASQLLDVEISLVRDMRASLTAGELLGLVGSKPMPVSAFEQLEKKSDPGTITALITDDGQNWLKLSETSVIKTRSIYLRELFAKNQFQVAVLDLRDLIKLQKLLQDWQVKLNAYSDLLNQKKIWRQQKEQKLVERALTEKQKALQQERDKLTARIESIKSNQDYMALADAKTRKTFVAVERSYATIGKLKSRQEDTSEYDDRLRMVSGLLMWRAAQDFSTQLAALEKNLTEIDNALSQVATSRAKIENDLNAGQDLAPMIQRINQQQKQVNTQLNEINNTINLRAEILRKDVDSQLDAQEKRLVRYQAQANFSAARLYDSAVRRQAK